MFVYCTALSLFHIHMTHKWTQSPWHSGPGHSGPLSRQLLLLFPLSFPALGYWGRLSGQPLCLVFMGRGGRGFCVVGWGTGDCVTLRSSACSALLVLDPRQYMVFGAWFCGGSVWFSLACDFRWMWTDYVGVVSCCITACFYVARCMLLVKRMPDWRAAFHSIKSAS